MEPNLVKQLEYLKTALPRLTFSENFGTWYLEFEAHYGETFECDTLEQLAQQLQEWIHNDVID